MSDKMRIEQKDDVIVITCKGDLDAFYAEEFKGGGTPGWLIAVIVIVCLAAAGGIGYGIYYGVKKKGKQKS